MNKELRAELLEKLAEIDHDQWMHWSKAVASEVSAERRARWEGSWVPYDQLDEKTKKFDREWAEKSLEIIEPYLTQGAEKAVVYKIDAARYPGLSKMLESK